MSSEQTSNNPVVAYRPPMAQAPQQAAITPAEIMRILFARMWLIILLTVGIAVLFTVLFFVLRNTSPEYTSEAYVEARMQASVGIWGVRENVARKEILALETAGVSAILNSETFFGDVLSRPEFQRTQWFTKLPADKHIELLKKNFSATPMRDTAYVKLVMKAGTPDDAREVLNQILVQFENNIKDDALGSLQSLRTSLESNRRNIENNLTTIRLEIETLTRGENVPPGWQGRGQTVVSQKMQMLSEEMVRFEAVLNQLDLERQQLAQQLEQGGLAQVVMLLEQDPVILGLRNQIMVLEQNEAQALGRFGEKHQEVIKIRDAIQSARLQMNDRQTKMSEIYTQQLLSDNARQMQLIAEQLSETTNNYNQAANQQRGLDKNAIVYEDKLRDAAILSQQLADNQRSIDEINIQINSRDNFRAVVKQRANQPTEMSFPKLPMFLAGGIVLGLMAGCGLAFLLELLNDTVRTPTDVRRYLNVPLLGIIPEYEEEGDLSKILVTRPSCITSEYIRQARTNLMFSAPADSLKTLLFTSCQAESGKTTMATAMAISLTQDNKKVLLIDANFYKPAMRKLFPGGGSEGLSNYLTDQNEINDVVHQTEIKNLSVIYSGPKPPNPTGLFSSTRMAELIRTQRAIFDYVIIDGPPSLIVLDAKVLSSLVDGTIAVVFAEEESRGMVNRMIRELRQMKANVIGIMLNGVIHRKGGYFKEAIKTYQDYVESEDVIASK